MPIHVYSVSSLLYRPSSLHVMIIFQANAAQYDRVEDISLLHHINEPSILHTLRERYASNLIHTFAGKRTLLIVRPRQRLAIYSETVIPFDSLNAL